MNGTQRFAIVAALGALGWYLYTRSQGLTLAGAPENPMLPAARVGQQSLVTPSTSTSTFATNVFGAIGGALRSIVTSLQAAPGNGPRIPSASSTGISQSDVQSWGLAVPRDEPAPAIASQVVEPADLAPFYTMGYGYNSGVPSMPWTLNPVTLGFDPNYIAPPPGR